MVWRSGDELIGDVGRVLPFPLNTGVDERKGEVKRVWLVDSRTMVHR